LGTKTITPPFDALLGQPLVARFLATAVFEGHLNHAYLFVGPLGSGKTEATIALAKAILCPAATTGGAVGSDDCEDCVRVARRTHPDLHIVEPEGVEGYLAAQIRELIHDATLAPVRSRAKIYVLTRADLLGAASANALLKTLEEPTSSVVFILMARTIESVLETLRSRCQLLAFRSIPEVEAVRTLTDDGAATEREARIALAATGGSPLRARAFVRSQARRDARVAVLGEVERMLSADSLDVLEAARSLTRIFKAPLDELRAAQSEQLEEGRDFLTKGGVAALEKRFTRQLGVREREQIAEALAVIRSWLRDCLLMRIGRGEDIVNTDFHGNIVCAAQRTHEAALIRALSVVDEAEDRMHYNVSVQSVFESLLFTIREVLEHHE
jgi:DNA polymerase-3 subunit delta'